MNFLLKIILIVLYSNIKFLDIKLFCHKSMFDTPQTFESLEEKALNEEKIMLVIYYKENNIYINYQNIVFHLLFYKEQVKFYENNTTNQNNLESNEVKVYKIYVFKEEVMEEYIFNKNKKLTQYTRFNKDGSILFTNKYRNNSLFKHVYFKNQTTRIIVNILQGEVQQLEIIRKKTNNPILIK